MVYSQALVFGYGRSVCSEEENLTELWRKMLQLFRVQRESSGSSGSGGGGLIRKASSSLSLGSECSLEDDDLDASLHVQQQDLIGRIEKCLVAAKSTSLRCSELLVPERMSARLAADVLRASADEPCGLRGALIHLFAETEDGVQKVGSVTAQSGVTPTFELYVMLRAASQCWAPLKHLLGIERVLRLRPEYQLIKRKLYSSAGPVLIHV